MKRSNTITRRIAKQIAAKWRHFYSEDSETRRDRISRQIDGLYSRLASEKARLTKTTTTQKH